MIKIPTEKYIGLAIEHYSKIRAHIEDAIKFYLYCCYMIDPKIKKGSIDLTVVDSLNSNTKKSLYSTISTKSHNKLTIKHVKRNSFIKNNFKNDVKSYAYLFESMLEISNDLYIRNIITTEPSNYEKLHKQLCSILPSYDDLALNILNKIFNYEKFSKDGLNGWSAYHYCQTLRVNVCPYCNRIYTHTIRKTTEDIIRPMLDHYVPKSKYPIFALSFYNLIPSCSYCNSSIKGNEDSFTFEQDVFNNYVHPYFDDEGFKFQFRPFDITGYNGNLDKLEIEVTNFAGKKIKNSINFFQIHPIYQAHKGIVSSLIIKRINYSDSNLEMISNLIGLEKEELFNITFDTIEEDEIIDNSLGKLRSDIVEQLKYLTF
jgi:hypothetical protein